MYALSVGILKNNAFLASSFPVVSTDMFLRLVVEAFDNSRCHRARYWFSGLCGYQVLQS